MRKSNSSAMVWCVTLACGLLSQTASAATALTALRAGDLVITEIMINPSGDNSKNEWFEIYNATTADVDLNGLIISGKSGETQTLATSVVVAAGDYALFAVKATNNGGAGTPDFTYTRSTNRFDNGSDKLTISSSTLEFDSVSWTSTGDFHPTLGYSLQLDSMRQNAAKNGDASRWCVGMTEYGTGGFGTPGTANESCGITTLSISDIVAGDLVVNEVMINPITVSDSYAEWFEIYNSSGVDININGLVLRDKDTDTYTIAKDVIVYADDVALLVPNDSPSRNGGLPKADATYTRSVFRFDDPSDEIYLYNGVEYIDQVKWSASTLAEGYSRTLSAAAQDTVSNDTSANWCAGATAYGTTTTNYGTPQATNDACP